MRLSSLLFVCSSVLFAQLPPLNPVVSPRGVVNTMTEQPSPTSVAPGGLLTISGLNLGPVQGAKAEPGLWPTTLGGVEVMINARRAPIGSVEPGRIVVQVPWEIPMGMAQVVVRRGELASRPARFFVQMPVPSLGAAEQSGSTVTVRASGLGMTEPRLTSGEAAAAEPRSEIRAFLGGVPLNPAVASSPTRVGEFDITFELPESVADGDLIAVVANNRAANRVPLRRLRSPEVLFMQFPDGIPEIRSILSADVRGTLLAAASARNADGCYRAWWFDLIKQTNGVLAECLTTAQRLAASPLISGVESPSIAALAGPPLGDAPDPVSSTVRILSAAKDEPFTVELPAPAVNINANAAGNFIANMGQGNSALEIDSTTGEVRQLQQGGGAVAANPLNPANLRIDLGDGVTTLLSPPVAAAQGVFVVIAGDSDDNPTRAKLGVLNARGEVTQARDFPSGWVPLIPPLPALPPGIQLPVGGVRAIVNFQLDAPSRSLLILSRKTDDSTHGIVRFSLGDEAVGEIAFPEGWFAATCSVRVPSLNIELARRLAFFADRSSANQIRNPCPAQGFVLYDIEAQTFEAVPLPGQGQMNAAGSANEMNDFVYATNIDPSRQGRADTVFVLDAVTQTAFRFDPPPEIAAIQNLTPVREMNALIAQAGDAGFVVFDVENVQTRVLPTPEGFNNMQLVGVFPATRKLVARGIRSDGTQLLVYDLRTGDLDMPANPEGVAFIGPPPVQQPTPGGGGVIQIPRPGPGPGPGQQQPPQQQIQAPVIGLRANARANTVEAIAYNSERQQVGVVVLRVP